MSDFLGLLKEHKRLTEEAVRGLGFQGDLLKAAQSAIDLGVCRPEQGPTGELCWVLVQSDDRFSTLTSDHRDVFSAVKTSGVQGVTAKRLKAQRVVAPGAVAAALRELEARGMIKKVRQVGRAGAVYMLPNLSPSADVAGGTWYLEGHFQEESVNDMRCRVLLEIAGYDGTKWSRDAGLSCVPAADHVQHFMGGYVNAPTNAETIFDRLGVMSRQTSLSDIQDVIRSLVLDNLVETRGNGDILPRPWLWKELSEALSEATVGGRHQSTSSMLGGPAQPSASHAQNPVTAVLTRNPIPAKARTPCVTCPLQQLCDPGNPADRPRPQSCKLLDNWERALPASHQGPHGT